MAAPAASDWLTQWQWSWTGVSLALVLGGGYLCAWVRARRGPVRLGTPQLVPVLGASALLLYVTCGPVGVYSTTLLWCFALRIGLLSAVVPLGVALGRPVEALGAALNSTIPQRLVQGSAARILMFPAVSSVLSVLSVMAVFFTDYGQSAASSGVVEALLVLHMMFVGLLVVLPLLSDDLLPAWATPGVRTLIACLDGLLDALPGILVMTASSVLMPAFPGFVGRHEARGDLSAALDQKFAGGVLLAVAETVGLPMLVAVFVEWMRQDERSAKGTDRALDALEDQGELSSAPWWVSDAHRPD